MLSFSAEDLEAVTSCLGDDAAALRDDNPECERAENMEIARDMLEEFQKVRQELLSKCDDSDGNCYGNLSTKFVRDLLR
jgi:hypothetical protein